MPTESPDTARSTPLRRRLVALAAAVVLGALAGCAAVEGVGEGEGGGGGAEAPVATGPAAVPDGFVPFPTGFWLTRDSVTPLMLVACEKKACGHEVALAVFIARGAEGRALAAALADPERLAAQARAPAPAAPARKGAKPPPRVEVKAGPVSAPAGWRGARVALARADGRRAAHTVVLGRTDRADQIFVVAVSDDAEAAELYARVGAEARGGAAPEPMR